MKRLIVLLFILYFPHSGIGREAGKRNVNIQTGYYGEMVTHPGMTLGMEYSISASPNHQMILSTNMGGYVHPRNNTSLFLREQWGQRVCFRNGVFIEQFIGLGYLHHFAQGGKIYEVLPNGAVVKVPNNGRPMFMPSVGVGAGYDLGKLTGKKIMLYVRPELFWKAPFNGYYLTHLALNAGLIFNIKSL